MFDQLSERLQTTLKGVRSRGSLTEADIDAAMREIRLALLEADVSLEVVERFVERVRERASGAAIGAGLNPGQEVVKIVSAELAALMGGEARELSIAEPGPTVILMAGLQGSGKTTACAKLAALLRRDGHDVALAACDLQRPAAVEQLVTLGERAGAPVYRQSPESDPVEVAAWSLERARADGRDALVVDTAGRLHIDDELMDELSRIRRRIDPDEVLLVLDSMTGQDAVNVGREFSERAGCDGIVLTKLDGDARGGAALSLREVTGKPILFVSSGEKVAPLERFHPDRMAGRILGMGDVLSLVEKVEREVDRSEAEKMERKLRKAQFTLEDFLGQMRQVRRMGSLTGMLGMLPGMGGALKQLQGANIDERELDRIEAMILSMTPAERERPEIIDGSRRRRIAHGSGTTIQAVNQLVKQFDSMRKLLGQMAGGKMPNIDQILGGALAGGMPGGATPRGGIARQRRPRRR